MGRPWMNVVHPLREGVLHSKDRTSIVNRVIFNRESSSSGFPQQQIEARKWTNLCSRLMSTFSYVSDSRPVISCQEHDPVSLSRLVGYQAVSDPCATPSVQRLPPTNTAAYPSV